MSSQGGVDSRREAALQILRIKEDGYANPNEAARAVQRAARRLGALGLITVDTSFSVGKVIALNVDTEAVKALQAFHRSIREM